MTTPPIGERDIYGAALVLLRREGLDGALAYGAQRRAELQAAGDLAGVACWVRIEAAVRVLAQGQPATGQVVQ